MKVGQQCNRGAVAISASSDIAQACRLMRDRHVGFLVVFQEGDGLRKPIGVLTDRDIVLQVTVHDLQTQLITVGDVMTSKPMIACEDDDLGDALQAMRFAKIRRVPVVDCRGALCGVVALDDAIELVAGMLCSIANSITVEQHREWRAPAAIA